MLMAFILLFWSPLDLKKSSCIHSSHMLYTKSLPKYVFLLSSHKTSTNCWRSYATAFDTNMNFLIRPPTTFSPCSQLSQGAKGMGSCSESLQLTLCCERNMKGTSQQIRIEGLSKLPREAVYIFSLVTSSNIT